jgi:O-antigen ligase
MVRAARWLTLASAVSIIFSIAASQVLLAMALAALFLSGTPLRLPRIWLPAALFMTGTIISLLLSDNPADGLSQIRKFYVWCTLLVVFSCFDSVEWAKRLYLCWAGAAAIDALRSFVQFLHKVQEARALGRGFYDFYVPERITGFMSHWMTFSAQMMYVILGLLALLLFSPTGRRRAWLWVACMGLAAVALVMGFTRGIAFVATPAAAVYLIWAWKPKAVLAVPLVALAAFFAAPASLKTRVTSMVEPTRVDSNAFRKVTWGTGLRMIEQHPWFGLGPERVRARFFEFVSPDVPRPLPEGWYGHLHNFYLHFAAERGIPTILALLWMIFQALADFWRGARRLPPGRSDLRFVLQAGVAVILATLIEGVFEHNLGDSEVLTMFLAAVGCGYVALGQAARERKTEGVVKPCCT